MLHPLVYKVSLRVFFYFSNNSELIDQTMYMLKTILKQNYFQYNEQLFQPEKGIAMGSPISSTMAEVYLQYLEET